MSQTNPGLQVNPKILAFGRTSFNMTIEDVARKIGQKPEVIQEWEAGTLFPTYAQLEKLATAYKIPLAIFLFPEIPEEYKIRSSFRTLPDSVYDKLDAHMILLFRNQKSILENMKELDQLLKGSENPGLFFENFSWISSEVQKNNLDHIRFRSLFGVSLDEQKSWKDSKEALETWIFAFESLGILVTRDAFLNDDISGFCLYDERYPLICLNNSHTDNRCIFTLFHEFAHLAMQTSGIVDRNDGFIEELEPSARDVEILCNKIAGKLLVPDDDFQQTIRRIESETNAGISDLLSDCLSELFGEIISEIAEIYHVSREVILRKFLDFGIIGPDTYEIFISKWAHFSKNKKEDKTKGGNYYSNMAVYLGDAYLKTVLSAYNDHKITDQEASLYLGGIKIDNIPKLEEAAILRWNKWRK
ncbi:hypothetical protein MsAm2_05460 [Methanolapillus ohkumae]|uniref:HTH cro/C1-type domain-containing protein n=2 Tax=Methanolapillus ohkumae TaxID=3028298 RepID=A0AA96V6J6_9EURY|nr:hypothetical protein MsAm2_05460 [Methanosarcinaceae archaeon Am2]